MFPNNGVIALKKAVAVIVKGVEKGLVETALRLLLLLLLLLQLLLSLHHQSAVAYCYFFFFSSSECYCCVRWMAN